MSVQKTIRPYGLWPSPVTPAMLGQQVRLGNPQFDTTSRTLLWVEGHSDRGVLVARPQGEARLDLTDEQSVRGTVGYGGGEFCASRGRVVFAERDGRLYRRALAPDRPRPITPPFGHAASPSISPDGKWVVYVFSDGRVDLLALVDSEGSQWPFQLVRGADFYMQPAWHPSGQQLAWVEWDHPNMPWDGTRLMLGTLAGDPPRLAHQVPVAGGSEAVAVEPRFSPDGRWLSYITSSAEWEDLVLQDLTSGMRRTLVSGDGFHLCEPAWVQGTRSYGWSPDGQRIYYIRNAAGLASLWSVEVESGRSVQIDVAPYTWLSDLSVSQLTGDLAMRASAPAVPGRILHWDAQEMRWRIEARSSSESLPPEYLPAPQPLTWKAPDGSPVYGLYTPPSSPDFAGAGLPPAILHVHGGPTSQEPIAYSSEAAFFTSRGYAFMVVNYRGSSGYGRSYRNALRLRWGEVDVDDAIGGAQAMVDEGLADPKKIVIEGGSAGGYTVLNALIHYPGRFKAGLCKYGVSNLFTLAMDTHKFELRYLDSMVGPLPETAARYHDWSPIFHAEAICDPLAVFQGKEDKVVPPAQSDEIVELLRRRGVPHIFKLYDGEGHGFRKRETIIDYYQETERFLQQYVLFAS